MTFKSFLKWLGGVFTRRLWLKALSVALALLLWAYIVGNNTSLTRDKQLTGLSLNVGTTSTLTSRSLALATDITAEYQNSISAVVSVPQSRFSSLTSSMVRVTPDYSGISKPGTYEVSLNASCSYGTVTKISPSTITVVVDNIDSRDLPIEVVLENRDTDNYWYDVDSISVNPQTVTVSGPASVIEKLSGAEVVLDVKNRTETFRRSQILSIETSDGSTFSSKLITKSSSTCSVRLEVYPKKTLEVRLGENHFTVPEGYCITDISYVPSTIVVAAEQELLDSIDYLPLELTGEGTMVNSTFTTRLSISGIDDFKYISSKQVYVTVTVSEIED